MNILVLYDFTQTYTNTVFEHLSSLKKYSKYSFFYSHVDSLTNFDLDLANFDAVCIHFSVRLPFDHISSTLSDSLVKYNGLKFLFIQDEYDFVFRTRGWILKLGIQLVFTTVPKSNIQKIYPSEIFPNTRFVTNLTGYVPDVLFELDNLPPPSTRPIYVGYRGRPLPLRYGMLGFEKVRVGEIVKAYCDSHGIINDIAWSEEARIYGPKWYAFLSSCKTTLGSESGCNVFDWNGDLSQIINQYMQENPQATPQEVYSSVIQVREINGLVNQVSPKIFEAIASRTVLVLFEGEYSGVIKPGVHFIELNKNGENISEVVNLILNGAYLDEMANRAWNDVIATGRYSYQVFVDMVENEIDHSFRNLGKRTECPKLIDYQLTSKITSNPLRSVPPKPSTDTILNTIAGSTGLKDFVRRLLIYMWLKLPVNLSRFLAPKIKHILGKV